MGNSNKILLLAISAVAMLVYLFVPTFSETAHVFSNMNKESDLVMLCVGSIACSVVAALLNRIPVVQKVLTVVNILIIGWFIAVYVAVVMDYEYMSVGPGMVALFVAEICNIIVLFIKSSKDSGTLLNELK